MKQTTIDLVPSPDNHDFSGMATKYNVKCADGRVILPDAFKHQDGIKVPLVWSHDHKSISNVVGSAHLEHETDGVRAYASFYDDPDSQKARKLVNSGVVKSLSIYANKLKQERQYVKHGTILELSLVFSGANSGAGIDNVVIHDGDDYEDPVYDETKAIIHFSEPIVLNEDDPTEETPVDTDDVLDHSDDLTVKDVLKTFNNEQMDLLSASIVHATTGEDVSIPNGNPEEIYKSLDERQKVVFDTLVVEAADSDNMKHEGENSMTHNVFEQTPADDDVLVLSHEDQAEILKAVIDNGTDLRTEAKKYALAHSITNVEYLFPKAQMVGDKKPEWYTDPQEWVTKVVDGARKSPFARIRSAHADITTEEARARGYIKGDQKLEQVFEVFFRETYPHTIYKYQKMDRDDIIDITDFDVLAWLRYELKLKHKEERARAYLIGDGRDAGDASRIDPTKIRPVYSDDDLYVIRPGYIAVDATYSEQVDAITESMTDYRGAGSPTLFASRKWIVKMLTLRDTVGRRLYSSKKQLADEMDVGDIVYVPFMDTVTRVDGADTVQLRAIILNMNDYVIGMDRGGKLTMFQDFNLEYNKEQLLVETRQSAALNSPKTAIVIEQITV